MLFNPTMSVSVLYSVPVFKFNPKVGVTAMIITIFVSGRHTF